MRISYRRCCVIFGSLAVIALSEGAISAERINESVFLNQVELEISSNAAVSAQEKQRIFTWLEHLTGTMLLVNGTQPRPELLIKLEIFRNSDRAVPFGRVLRRQPPGIRFYVNPEATLESFESDWTPYHEASHLFIPYPGQRDIWFSEGLASYYQNVLRFRTGIFSAEQTWRKFYSGFKRARDDTRDSDLSLSELSAQLQSKRAYMRVYWTGALYFLEADMQLRNASNQQQSLDTVLLDFANCCLPEQRRWSGIDLARQFDKLAKTNIFAPLYNEYASSHAIPNFKAILSQAGVDVVGDSLRLSSARPKPFDLGGLASHPAN